MSRTLFSCAGGDLALPDRKLVLVSRLDGGNLIVNPPREVWERSELAPDELVQWSFLIAAAGRSMLDALPQLEGGCINYWEAGNWTLNEQADPIGPKTAPAHRRVHMHLLGRSRTATDTAWRWGEAPKFPDFAERHSWAARFERLTADECRHIVGQIEKRLRDVYGFSSDQIEQWSACPDCGYPMTGSQRKCTECRDL